MVSLHDARAAIPAPLVSPAMKAEGSGGGDNVSSEHDGRREAASDVAVDHDALVCASAAMMVGGGAVDDVDLRQKSVELAIAIVANQQHMHEHEQQLQQPYTAPPCLSDATALLQSWLHAQVRWRGQPCYNRICSNVL